MISVPVRRILFWLKVSLVLGLVSYIVHRAGLLNRQQAVHHRYPPQSIPPYVCKRTNLTITASIEHNSRMKSVVNAEPKVLIFVETLYSKLGKQIISIIDALKLSKKVETLTKNLPLLTTAKRGRFSVIIIENYYKYLNLPLWNRQLLDKYCRDYGVGIIAFLGKRPSEFINAKGTGINLSIKLRQQAHNLRFSNTSRVLFIAKPGAILENPIPDIPEWTLFDIKNGHESIVSADDSNGTERAAVILDYGLNDGIERILFGHNFTHWINKIAFIDSLRYIGNNFMSIDLTRYIQIDVDDIFVGASGSRMTRSDADALLHAQNRLRKSIKDFTFCLGFSGHYFRSGDALEDEGDERLIEIGKNFVWFPHMWKHNHAHEHNQTYLEAMMMQNKLFAQAMGLPVSSWYAVSPQHAGVYPIHDALYNAWHSIWNIAVTSTEEYPHFRPASARRGFVHMNISVLPRQTCGLYTHTQFFHSYPDGLSKLMNNIEGGDLFFTILLNPFSIFMTHQQNYANDRLGTFSFERVVEFIKCWTNLRLRWMEPFKIASAYFARYSLERTPIWSNPCSDSRHTRIIPPAINCSDIQLPNLLIVGPQKTGSTALATFLALHPDFSTNAKIPGSFEELQFFGGTNYGRGILWYMEQFRSKMQSKIVFEKSATYFDNSIAPRAAAALLPKGEIVVILLDPAIRAYSWYQHMRAHNDSAATSLSFYDVLMANASSLPSVKRFRNRCISPGRYAHHLERWLEYFPLSQIHLIDGEEMKLNPVVVLKKLVESLHMPSFAFENYLKFDNNKGFYCVVINGAKKCLGTSKGRKYAAVDRRTRECLNSIFREDNIALHRLLLRFNLSVPNWLQKLLSQTRYSK